MSKAQWKQPALKQAEKKVADREQAIQEAKYWKQCYEELRDKNTFLTAERNEAKAKVNELRGKAGAYDFLRREGVVLMSDEPKHLQGEDMDKYIERHTWNDLGKKYSNELAKSLNMSKNEAMRQIMANASFWAEPSTLTFKATGRYTNGSNAGIQSKEADQKDTGHYTDILRYAYWYGLWEQRRS
jgi:hypothetical protein